MLGVLLALEMFSLLSGGNDSHRWLSVPITSGRGTGVASVRPPAPSPHPQPGTTPGPTLSGGQRSPTSNGSPPSIGTGQPNTGPTAPTGPGQQPPTGSGNEGQGPEGGREGTGTGEPSPRTSDENTQTPGSVVTQSPKGKERNGHSGKHVTHHDNGRHLGWVKHSPKPVPMGHGHVNQQAPGRDHENQRGRGHGHEKDEGHGHEKHEGHGHEKHENGGRGRGTHGHRGGK
jgi:hypothetical protein